MLFKKMYKIIITINTIFLINLISPAYANNTEFVSWVDQFKKRAISSGVSKFVVDDFMSGVKYLPKVIEYDRYQPEFYESTFTYIKKRTNKSKIKKGLTLYNKEKNIINKIEKEYSVDKELLLSLMGIETNFGNYLGRMDIISSLSTLSFDQRRSEFFTSELLILLNLVNKKIIEKNILFGSWAGAFGNFQFMPRTIKNYAIDYDNNEIIELKKISDSFASAANYLSKIGWNQNTPCFTKIKLKNNIPTKYLNSSARNIKNKKKNKVF